MTFKRIIEQAVTDICGLQGKGLWFCVDAVEPCGRPTHRIRVWGTLHFLQRDTPYCCGEPGCHLGLVGDRLAEVSEAVRLHLKLASPVMVEFENRIAAKYQPGIEIQNEKTS